MPVSDPLSRPGRAHKRFKAMGSPCEIQLYAPDLQAAQLAFDRAIAEIERLEQKFSRYREGNYLAAINDAGQQGGTAPIDSEFRAILDYADFCFRLSDGMFDITSGVLRKAWNFRDFSIPDERVLADLLGQVGWSRVAYDETSITFGTEGMELDFGGIVKEYAADAASKALRECGIEHGIVDLGGDICVLGPHPGGRPWAIDIAHPRGEDYPLARIEIAQGGIASSGDYERFVEIDGQRYSHILSPKTGWPIRTMAAVTVASENCVSAGSGCTIGMLQEEGGPAWLAELGLPHVWIDHDRRGGAGGMDMPPGQFTDLRP